MDPDRGSAIRDTVFGIRVMDPGPGWKKNPDPGTGMNIQSKIIFRELRKGFGLKILKFFDADLDPVSGVWDLFDLDPGWKKIQIQNPS